MTDQEIRPLEGVYGADFLIPKPPAAHQCRLLNFSPIDALTDPAAARGMTPDQNCDKTSKAFS